MAKCCNVVKTAQLFLTQPTVGVRNDAVFPGLGSHWVSHPTRVSMYCYVLWSKTVISFIIIISGKTKQSLITVWYPFHQTITSAMALRLNLDSSTWLIWLKMLSDMSVLLLLHCISDNMIHSATFIYLLLFFLTLETAQGHKRIIEKACSVMHFPKPVMVKYLTALSGTSACQNVVQFDRHWGWEDLGQQDNLRQGDSLQ